LLLVFSSAGFMYFELEAKPNLTWLDAFWWSVVTMTTVGYGDFFPETVGGRYLVGFPTMLLGISILGYLLSVMATYLIDTHSKERRGMAELSIKDHILLIHFQSMSRVLEIINELKSDSKTRDRPIVLIDSQLEEIPPEIAKMDVQFVKGSPTKESTLAKANYSAATHAIILAADPQEPSSDNHTLAVALTLEKLHSRLFTVAECIDPEQVELMRKSGCDSVVCIAQLSSMFMVQELLDPGVQRVFKELTSTTYGQQIFVVRIDTLKRWRYEEVVEHLTATGYVALGIERDRQVMLNPDRDLELSTADSVVCLGSKRLPSLRIS
jgi:voltage-gated potassium channel